MSELNLTVFIFGIVAIIILIFGEKFLPGKPIAIIVVMLSITLISVTSIGTHGLNTVGAIPNGLPEFRLPSLRFEDVECVLPLAIACCLLTYIESVSTARTIAQKNGNTINARQELLALGVSNIAVGLSLIHI